MALWTLLSFHFEAKMFPVDLGKCYAPLWKALKHSNWQKFWNREHPYLERCNIHLTESSAFSYKRVWQLFCYCHTHFYDYFWKPYTRALKWGTICFRILYMARVIDQNVFLKVACTNISVHQCMYLIIHPHKKAEA